MSRAYACRLGLLPRNDRLERVLDHFRLEWGRVGGALMVAGGAAVHWSRTDFGRLTTDDMRLPLAGMLLVVAGTQVVMVSFLLSLSRAGRQTAAE